MKLRAGPWQPDAPALIRALTVARNCVPIKGGYGPMKTPVLTETTPTALAGRARGAIAGRRPNGVAYNFAGTDTDLYELKNESAAVPGQNVVTRTMNDPDPLSYNCDGKARWYFRESNGIVLAASQFDQLQYYDLQGSLTFENVPGAPRAKVIGLVGQHPVVGDTYDIVDGRVPNRLRWPALANPISWPDLVNEQDLALSLQSGAADLRGNGGAIMAIAGGAEVGAVFQERALWRMEYRGGDVQYELNRVQGSNVHGLLVPDLAISYGREVLYLAETGWWIFDFTNISPIGEEVVNRTFLADLDSAYLDRISWQYDPDRPLIYVLYPGAGNSSGTPNKILIYNYVLRQFSDAIPTIDLELLVHSVAPGVSLDAPAFDGLDALNPQMDEASTITGARVAGAYNTSHQLMQLTGAAMEATLEWGDVQLENNVAYAAEARPLVEGGTSLVQVSARMSQKDTHSFSTQSREDRDGKCPLRKSGRFHRFRLIVEAGGFTNAHGLDIMHTPAGSR